jgi:hypothetical protein
MPHNHNPDRDHDPDRYEDDHLLSKRNAVNCIVAIAILVGSGLATAIFLKAIIEAFGTN